MCACTEPVKTGIGAVCVEYGRPKWPITMLNHTHIQKNVLFFIRGKRVSNCCIPKKKFVCSTNVGFSGEIYTSTPPQQYQYVPKETVRHHASCEEVYTYVYPVSLAATK